MGQSPMASAKLLVPVGFKEFLRTGGVTFIAPHSREQGPGTEMTSPQNHCLPLWLLVGVGLAVSGCSNYLVSVSPPALSSTELVAGPSPLAVGVVIADDLRNYQVVQRPWANVAYTFQLGQSLGKTIENSAQHAFSRAVLLKAEGPWEVARQERLDRVVMVSLENAVVDAKRVGTFSQRGAMDVRVTLRVRVYDPAQKLLEDKILVGEGASTRSANSTWGNGTWGNSGPDIFTPGVKTALQDISRKCFRYFSGLKR